MPRVTGEVRPPVYYNEDFSMLKNTPIHENIVFQLKFGFPAPLPFLKDTMSVNPRLAR